MNSYLILFAFLLVGLSNSAVVRNVNPLDTVPSIVEESKTTKTVEPNYEANGTTHLPTNQMDENVKTVVEQAQENIENVKQHAKENIDRILQEASENLQALNSTASPSTTRHFAANESRSEFPFVEVVGTTQIIQIDQLTQTDNPLIQRVKENVERLAQEARENAQTAHQQVKENLEVIRKETEGHDDDSN